MVNKKFIWSDEYNVESEITNEEHRHFFEIANKIIDMANDSKTERNVLFGVICEFGNYALYHIDQEEETLKKSNDPRDKAHIEAHKLFREKVKKFIDCGENKNEDIVKIADDVISFLMAWINDHISIPHK